MALEDDAPGTSTDRLGMDAIQLGNAAGQECLEAAISYLALGWGAIVLCPPDHIGVGRTHSKDCGQPGKVPLRPWKEYHESLPTEDDLKALWRSHPNANVGMAYGSSNLVGIDVDGPGGEKLLQQKSKGDLPPTLEFVTPGGGRRLLYSVPVGASLRTTYQQPAKGEELRFQGKGAQTVMPPSRHTSGGRYAWVDGRGPGDLGAAVAPAWLVEELTDRGGKRSGEGKSSSDWDTICAGVPEGGRNSTAAAMIGKVLSMIADLTDTSALRVAYALLSSWNNLNDPPLADREFKTVFQSILRKEIQSREARDSLSEFIQKGVASSVVEVSAPEPVATAPTAPAIATPATTAPSTNGTHNSNCSTAAPQPPSPPPNGSPSSPPDWHLIIIQSDPVIYKLRSPLWSDSPKLDNGYLKLTDYEISNWSGVGRSIRMAALAQSQKIIGSDKKWGRPNGPLQKLIEVAEIQPAPPESKRTLVVLAFLKDMLDKARVPRESSDGKVIMSKRGHPMRLWDGSVVFQVYPLLKIAKKEYDSVGRTEIMDAIKAMALKQIKLAGKRWWKATTGDIGRIADAIGDSGELSPSEEILQHGIDSAKEIT